MGFVDGLDGLSALEFEDNSILDQHIDSVSAVNEHAFVTNGKFKLPLKPKPALAQLVSQTSLVGGL